MPGDSPPPAPPPPPPPPPLAPPADAGDGKRAPDAPPPGDRPARRARKSRWDAEPEAPAASAVALRPQMVLPGGITVWERVREG
jgi:hypothetical protein